MFARLLLIILCVSAPAIAQSDEIQDRFRRAAELQRQGAWQEAAEEYRALLERAPNYAEAQANFGVVLARLGKYDEAVRAYETALRLNPSCLESPRGAWQHSPGAQRRRRGAPG